jgi:signal peptidase I
MEITRQNASPGALAPLGSYTGGPVQPALTRPPLPKLAWLAAAIALLNAAYLIFAALSAQTFVVLPLALIPLVAAIGILRRNIWSARGFALYQLCGIVLVLFLGVRTTLPSADRATLIATASLTLLLAVLFFLAARSLARAEGKLGRPQLWIAVSVFVVFPLFFLQAFSIPTASMEDTLLVGDFVLVQRWPKPVVARGDAIVLPYPLDPHEDHIKRIVGVAGDRLRIANKVLYRNGAPVTEPYARHKTTYIDAYRDNFPSQPNTPLQPPAQDMLTSHVVNGEVVVPAGKYFVMGDNRDNSLDSRYFGFVDAATVLGKPILIYNSIDRPISDTTLVPQQRGRVRWNRLFRIVR